MRVLKSLTLAAALCLPMAATAFAEDQHPRITVSGEGRVDARPDMATISIGVTTEGKTAAEALSANSAQLTVVLENLRAAGIEDRDLQTSGLSLNPNWQHDENGQNPKITGYMASNQLDVRVRALDGLGAVLDAAVKDGANTLNGLTFGVSEQGPLLDEARKRAVADAKAKASLLAEAAGVKLGTVQSITEGGGYAAPVPMFRMEAGMAADMPVPVAQGEVSMNTTVTIVWELAQ